MPDLSLEICDRAYVPLFETAHGLERKPVYQSGEYRLMDVVVRPGLLATAPDAG